MFTKNIGSVDRILRIVIGIAITSLAFIGPQSPWAYLGLILVITAFINFCPIYSLIGMKTIKKG